MFPYLFKIGSFELRVYSLMLMLGVLIAIYFAGKRSKSLGLDVRNVENAVILIFLVGILGARIYYVIFNWPYFREYPREILAVWQGGLAIHGGIIAGVAFSIFYCAYKKLPFFKLADIFAPFILLAQGIGRFGNFANGEAHGVPVITPPSIIFRWKPVFQKFWSTVLTSEEISNTPQGITALYHKILAAPKAVMFQGHEYILKVYVPWGISFPPTHRPQAYREFGSMPVHPTFFYEMILNFIGAFILFRLWKKDENIGTGKVFALYLVMYGLIRAFVTFFRADDLMLGPLRAPHAASLGLLAGALAVYLSSRYVNRKNKPKIAG